MVFSETEHPPLRINAGPNNCSIGKVNKQNRPDSFIFISTPVASLSVSGLEWAATLSKQENRTIKTCFFPAAIYNAVSDKLCPNAFFPHHTKIK